MLRIHWFDREPAGAPAPITWREVAIVVAPLFLNCVFWVEFGNSVPFAWPLPVFVAITGICGALIVMLFFTGPALACRASNKTLPEIIEDSFGRVPAWALRFSLAWFLVLWIGGWIWLPAGQINRALPQVNLAVASGVVVLFLLSTGLQSFQTNLRLASFSNKLGLAVLCAAMLRVHEGWPMIASGFPESPGADATYLYRHLCQLSLYLGPMLLVGSSLGRRLQAQRRFAMSVGLGVALPLIGTLLIAGVIAVATFRSPFHQPSLEPTVMMALLGKASGHRDHGVELILALTAFGAIRFAARAFADAAGLRALRLRWGLLLIASLTGFVAWQCIRPFETNFALSYDIPAAVLITVAAVLSADHFGGKHTNQHHPRRFDWIGVGGLTGGLGTTVILRSNTAEPLWSTWIFPTYAVSFAICLTLRKLAILHK